MGTASHTPDHHKNDWHGRHDDLNRAARAGERPGVPSRVEAARARLKKRGAL